MGAISNVLPFILIAWGQIYITGSVSSILNATTPIMTLILAHFLTHDEKLSGGKIFGVLTGFTGIYIMMSPTLKDGLSFEGLGQLAVIGGSLCYALAGIWGKRFSDTPPSVNATCMLACSSIILLPTAFIFETPFSLSPALPSFLAVCGLATLGTGIAYILSYRIIASAGASYLSLVTLLVPIHATIIGIAFLGETLTAPTIIGMGVILLGLIFVDGKLLKLFKNLKG